MTLGGNVCIRNGFSLDYCFQEAIESLLPVCESVTVCDGESDDGTQEFIRSWMKRESKIRLCIYPWQNPRGNIDFWVDWINFAREQIREDFQIQLDGDEILHEQSYPIIHKLKSDTQSVGHVSFWCHRHNFWRDAHHLIPYGVCCANRVVRVAPQNVWLPSDGPHPRGSEAIEMAVDSEIIVAHYGFLRKREAYFEKSRQLHTMFFGSMSDKRLIDAEKSEGNWMTEIKGVEWTNRVVPFSGSHPAIIHQWLKERGYQP